MPFKSEHRIIGSLCVEKFMMQVVLYNSVPNNFITASTSSNIGRKKENEFHCFLLQAYYLAVSIKIQTAVFFVRIISTVVSVVTHSVVRYTVMVGTFGMGLRT